MQNISQSEVNITIKGDFNVTDKMPDNDMCHLRRQLQRAARHGLSASQVRRISRHIENGNSRRAQLLLEAWVD